MSIVNRVGSNLVISWYDRTPYQRVGIILGLFMTAFTIFALGGITVAMMLGRGM